MTMMMDDLCYVYRDFNPGNGYFIGNIELFILPNNKIELQIMGLHQNDYVDMGSQCTVIVTYHENKPLYDVIITILDKITYDHKYMLRGIEPKDFIFCSNNLIKNNPELVNFDTTANTDGSPWMEFNQENIKYLGVCEDVTDKYIDNTIIYGNIDETGNFSYDYPIVSRKADQEYYKITRGRCVWDIDYDKITQTYIELSQRTT